MIISAIVAVGKNNVIGKNNEIPWYLPADLKYFKKTTLHHTILMGRKTFLSIGRPLPKRKNIVITRDLFFTGTGIIVAHSIEEGLNLAYQQGAEELFIIGGGQIYEKTQQYWDKIYLTEVEIEVTGDIFFPAIDYNQWQLAQETTHQPDEKNRYAYTFKVYEKISV